MIIKIGKIVHLDLGNEPLIKANRHELEFFLWFILTFFISPIAYVIVAHSSWAPKAARYFLEVFHP